MNVILKHCNYGYKVWYINNGSCYQHYEWAHGQYKISILFMTIAKLYKIKKIYILLFFKLIILVFETNHHFFSTFEN